MHLLEKQNDKKLSLVFRENGQDEVSLSNTYQRDNKL